MSLNIAHRGGAGLWPENTMGAFERAFALGADGVEMDVQLTKDGKIAIFHDHELKPEIVRDASGAWLAAKGPRISTLSYDDLRVFDVGRVKPGTAYAARSPKQQALDGERIPLLDDLVRAAKRAGGKKLWIELKTPLMGGVGQERPALLADAVLDLLVAEDALELATIVAFDWGGPMHAKRREPRADVRFLTLPQHLFAEGPVSQGEGDPPARQIESLREMQRKGAPWEGGVHAKDHGGVLGAIKAGGAGGWYAFYTDITADTAAAARALGLSYAAWTVNETADMRRLVDLGCDAVCTDRPDRLKALLHGEQ